MNAEDDGNDTLGRWLAFTQRRPTPDNGTNVPRKSILSAHRLPAVFITAALVIVAVACGGKEEEASPNATPTVTLAPTRPPTVPYTPSNCPPPPVETPPPVQAKSYPQRPALTIDPSHVFVAHVYTTRGHFIMELLPKLAPEHVNSFVFLARERFFDGTVFHRVVRDPPVVQGGDPTGTGRGGPGYTIPLELSEEPFVRGVLGMARTPDPDSAGSQWFVTTGDALFLNDPASPREQRYTVFGKVTQGMEVVDCIQKGDAIISLVIQEI